jgi:hypothetical protein
MDDLVSVWGIEFNLCTALTHKIKAYQAKIQQNVALHLGETKIREHCMAQEGN